MLHLIKSKSGFGWYHFLANIFSVTELLSPQISWYLMPVNLTSRSSCFIGKNRSMSALCGIFRYRRFFSFTCFLHPAASSQVSEQERVCRNPDHTNMITHTTTCEQMQITTTKQTLDYKGQVDLQRWFDFFVAFVRKAEAATSCFFAPAGVDKNP